MMNEKRGQIPIFMLLVVAIVLCVAALFALSSYRSNFENNSLLTSRAIDDANFAQGYASSNVKMIAQRAVLMGVSADLKKDFMSYASDRDYKVEKAGNFFRLVKEAKFEFKKEGVGYKFEMKGISARAVYENNEVLTSFDLCLMFDNKGNFARKC